MPYAVPLLFMDYSMRSWDTELHALISCPNNGRESVCVYSLQPSENLGQPLGGEFHSSLPLPSTNRQLSVIQWECTIPLHRIFVYQLATTLPSSPKNVKGIPLNFSLFSAILITVRPDPRICCVRHIRTRRQQAGKTAVLP